MRKAFDAVKLETQGSKPAEINAITKKLAEKPDPLGSNLLRTLD